MNDPEKTANGELPTRMPHTGGHGPAPRATVAIAFVHGGKGIVIRADATWPSATEKASLLFTEASRTQPLSPEFSWAAAEAAARAAADKAAKKKP